MVSQTNHVALDKAVFMYMNNGHAKMPYLLSCARTIHDKQRKMIQYIQDYRVHKNSLIEAMLIITAKNSAYYCRKYRGTRMAQLLNKYRRAFPWSWSLCIYFFHFNDIILVVLYRTRSPPWHKTIEKFSHK